MLEESAGRVAEAQRHIAEALALRSSLDHPEGMAEALLIRGRLRQVAGGADAVRDDFERARALASRASVRSRIEGHWLLWRATKDPGHPEAARALVVHLGDHAPEDLRDSLIEKVPLHRAIMEAAGRQA